MLNVAVFSDIILLYTYFCCKHAAVTGIAPYCPTSPEPTLHCVPLSVAYCMFRLCWMQLPIIWCDCLTGDIYKAIKTSN